MATRNERKRNAKARASIIAQAVVAFAPAPTVDPIHAPEPFRRAAGDHKGARIVIGSRVGNTVFSKPLEPIKRTLVLNRETGRMIERRKRIV